MLSRLSLTCRVAMDDFRGGHQGVRISTFPPLCSSSSTREFFIFISSSFISCYMPSAISLYIPRHPCIRHIFSPSYLVLNLDISLHLRPSTASTLVISRPRLENTYRRQFYLQSHIFHAVNTHSSYSCI